MENRKLQIGIFIFLLIALPLFVAAVRIASDLRSSADPAEEPKELIISNITDTSVTISWVTSAETTGTINYGTTAEDLTFAGSDYRDETESAQNYNTHYIRLKNLTPDTKYYFEINSGSSTYSNGDTPYEFQTLRFIEDLTTPETLIGSIGTPVTDAIVYAHASNGTTNSIPISVHTTSENFALVKANMREKSSGEPFEFSNAKIYISVTNDDGSRGSTEVVATEQKTSDISISPSGSEYDPALLLAVDDITPTTTPAPTSNPSSTTTTPSYTVNTAELLQRKVSYGGELSNPTVPYSIFLSNISATRLCVNWLTKQATIGSVVYQREGRTQKASIDGRDSLATQSKRYTHKVCIFESDLSEGEKIAFHIYSNNSPFGVNSGLDRYVFAAPEAPASPPSPEALEGNVTKNYTQLANDTNRDVLISGRYEEGSTVSSWVSDFVQTNNTWVIDYGSILDTTLSDYYTSSGATFALYANGEFNSRSNEEVLSNDDVVIMTLNTGLAITSPEHDSTVPNIVRIIGTAQPNTSVDLRINDFQASASAGSSGQWETTFEPTSEGKYEVTASDTTGDVLGLSFQSSNSALPSTAAKDWIPYLIGIGFIFLGLAIKGSIKDKQNSQTY